MILRKLPAAFVMTWLALAFGTRPLHATQPVVMKMLVLAGSFDEQSYQSISTYLAQVGVPFQPIELASITPDASGNRLSTVTLSDSATSRGLYQGIILTDSSFAACTPSCLSSADWTQLSTYASQFSVRIASYYTAPAAKWGLVPADSGTDVGGASPLNVTLTQAGASVFSYLNANNTIPVGGQGTGTIRVYRATPIAAANETTTPLLITGGYTIAATHTTADGRETLALTMDNQPELLHSQAFGYGVINWVTKGVFLGSRRVYFNLQNDDLLLGNWLYAPQLHPSCESDGSCPTYFMTGPDLTAHAQWQANLQSDPQFQTYRGTFAYNGVGTTWFSPEDPIFAAIKSLNSQFWWLSHTWDHANLDCYSFDSGGNCVPATLAESLSELTQNIAVAPTLGITLDTRAMVTPFNSGLADPAFLQAAAQVGIKYIVFPQYPDSPNTGVPNSIAPSILHIPRFNNNLYDDVSSPYPGVLGSWPDEYNKMHGLNGDGSYDQDQTYTQILDNESQVFLQNYMLTYSPYLLAFHIANTATYDGTHSLYSDLIDHTVAKYRKLFNLPALTLNMEDIGALLEARASFNNSGVIGIYTPGVGVELTTTTAATIPVTGACSQVTCSTYGAQTQDNVVMAAGSTAMLSLATNPGVTPSSITLDPSNVTAGLTSTGMVTLSAPVASDPILVSLSSSNSAVSVPGTVTIAAGMTTATFQLSTKISSASSTATITATYNAVSKNAVLTVTPTPAALSSVSVNPASLTGGTSSTGIVTLSAPAPGSGALVKLTSGSASVTVPDAVTISAGDTTATFAINSAAVKTATAATITAKYSSSSIDAGITLLPAPVVSISSLTVSSTIVTSGTSLTGTITLTGAAPTGGVTVSLTSSDIAGSVPASVIVPSGSSSVNFAVSTSYVAYWTQIKVMGSLEGVTKSADLTITPLASISLLNVSLSQATVQGGTLVTGTVTLSAPAPASGVPVELWTTGAAAYVPLIITVPGGSTTGTFTLSTASRAADIQETLAAFYNGTIKTAPLTVTP